MRGSDAVEGFHRLHHVLVEPHATVNAAGHDGLEADGGEVIFFLDVSRVFELKEAIADRFCMIGDTLEAAFVEKPLLAVREIEQAPLKRRGTKIGDQDLHKTKSEI